MLKGISPDELADRIITARAAKQDMIADTDKLEMLTRAAPSLAIPAFGTYPLRPLAHTQIANRLQIPVRYYNRMLTEQRDLLAANVNTWFKANPDRRLIRAMNGEVRAFLSNRYQRIEHEEIASVVMPILRDVPGLRFMSCEMTESRLYIHATTERLRGEVKRGDVVEAGVLIKNSEVGLGSVSVQPIILRLVCLNGAVMDDGAYRAAHLGRAIDDNEALWADDTRKADDKAILLKVRDMVKASLDEAMFRQRVARMQGLTDMMVEGSANGAVELLAQKVNATSPEADAMLRALIAGGDLSAWGLANAVTATAHTVEDYDRAVEFEEAGGALMSMPANDWLPILRAAA